MKTIQIRHLIDLVAGDVDDGESRIEQVFKWRFERDLVVIRWLLGLAASLSVAVLVAYFRFGVTNEASPGGLLGVELVGALSLAVASATYGIYRLIQLRRLHEHYVAALKLYGQISGPRVASRNFVTGCFTSDVTGGALTRAFMIVTLSLQSQRLGCRPASCRSTAEWLRAATPARDAAAYADEWRDKIQDNALGIQ